MRWRRASAPCGSARTRIARCAARWRRSRTCRRIVTPWRQPVPSEPLGILLLSGAHDRAHYAFVVASGAAALGRRVVLFATNGGCHALLADWSGLTDSARDAQVRAAGVAGLDADALWDGVEVAGIATFLSAVGTGQIISI